MGGNRILFYIGNEVELVEGQIDRSFEGHSHRSLCIGRVVNGCAQLSIREETYQLKKGSLYLVLPHTHHTLGPLSDAGHSENSLPFAYKVLCLRGLVFESYTSSQLKSWTSLEDPWGHFFEGLCDRLMKEGPFHGFEKAIQDLLEGAFYVSKQPGGNPQQDPSNIYTQTAVAYISSHLDEPFDLARLSEHLHLSRYHLIRCFKHMMGVTPQRFYAQEKIKAVRRWMLEEGDGKSLALISQHLSYTDQSHMANVFRRQVGISPGQYKQSCRRLPDQNNKTLMDRRLE